MYVSLHPGHSVVYSATFSGNFEGSIQGALEAIRGVSGGQFRGVSEPFERENLQKPEKLKNVFFPIKNYLVVST